MSRFKQIDLSRVKTESIGKRKSKVSIKDFSKIFSPDKENFSQFINSLPSLLSAEHFRNIVDAILRARNNKKHVVAMLGAHVVKAGCSPIIIDLIDRDIITVLVCNSALVIHDFEIALRGETSEDVAEYLPDGKFGMWRETGEFINNTLKQASRESNDGYGEALGEAILKSGGEFVNYSILASCALKGIPVTVHTAVGTDITHQQPSMDGGATGEMSFRDFKVLCNLIAEGLDEGVVVNFGSAVILPEVFLKALTVARNLGNRVENLTTANFDMIQHYRPVMNVVTRPTDSSGRGYTITGHHEITIPLLAACIKSAILKDE